MSRSKIFNMIKNRGSQQLGRNAFDLSGFESYSEKCQTINVVRAIDTLPDDYLKIKISDFTQCNGPMKTAAFVRGTREMAAYYVPYNTIWHNFNQYQATREDPDSVLLHNMGISYEPRFSQFELYMNCALAFAEYIYCHYYQRFINLTPSTGSDFWNATDWQQRLLDLYQAPTDLLEKALLDEGIATESDTGLSILYGYNDVVSDCTDADNNILYPSIYPHSKGVTPNRSYIALDTVGNYCWSDMVRKLDMLGYGNIYPIFDTALTRILSANYSMSVNVFFETIQGYQGSADATDILAFLSGSGGMKELITNVLMDMIFQLKYICNSDSSLAVQAHSSSFRDTYVNVYKMLAYNRCFYDMFRNSYFDLDYNITCYNCDQLICTSLAGSILRSNNIDFRAFKLESHQYKKDMFTGVLPDTQFGAVSSVDISNVNIVNLVGSTDVNAPLASAYVSSYASGGFLNRGATVSSDASSWSIPSAFDVLALRRAECLQQYRMDLLRAGNKTRDIFKQIYGTNPKSELDEAPYFIDVFGQDLKIDPIIATSDTQQGTNGNLGDIAARVTSRGDATIKFSTQDFGVIIIVDYTLIDPSYASTMLDPENTILTQEGRFIPQLMNLGFEPVIGDSLSIYKSASIRHRTLGYALPYLSKKTYVDKVHGNFVSCELPTTFYDYQGDSGLQTSGIFTIDSYVGPNSIWTVTRKDMQNADTVELKHFYGNPNILDDVMVLQFDPTFDSDQFICHTLISVDSIRPLSELGLPRFC